MYLVLADGGGSGSLIGGGGGGEGGGDFEVGGGGGRHSGCAAHNQTEYQGDSQIENSYHICNVCVEVYDAGVDIGMLVVDWQWCVLVFRILFQVEVNK